MDYQFFIEELKKTLAVVYKEPVEAKALRLIPLTHEMPEGMEVMEIPIVTEVGMARVIADKTTELPDVSRYVEFIHAKVKTIGNQFSYSQLDIQRAKLTSTSIPATNAILARKTIEQKMEEMAWLGDPIARINGLANYPSLPEVILPNGAGGAVSWDSKTPDEIIKDISEIYLSIRENSKNMATPSTLILPSRAWNKLVVTRVSNMTDETLMGFIRKSYPGLTVIEDVPLLATAGAGGGSRGLMYVNNPQTLRLEIPQPFQTGNPQEKGLLVQVPCWAQTFGVIVSLPYNIAFFDGI